MVLSKCNFFPRRSFYHSVPHLHGVTHQFDRTIVSSSTKSTALLSKHLYASIGISSDTTTLPFLNPRHHFLHFLYDYPFRTSDISPCLHFPRLPRVVAIHQFFATFFGPRQRISSLCNRVLLSASLISLTC